MASKRAIRRKSCGSKKKYSSSEEGRQAIHDLIRTTGPTSLMQTYKCKFCKKYHIGHAPKFNKY